MSFSIRGLFAVSTSICLVPLAAACGSDDGSRSPSSDASAGGSGAQGGGGASGGGSGGAAGGAVGGGGAGVGGGGAGGAAGSDGGGGCSLGCVHGTCVDTSGTPTCQCDATYSGALCDEITMPPTGSVVLWLDADDGDRTGSAARLTRWYDKSPAGLVAFAGPEPPDGGDAGDGGSDASVVPVPPVVDAGADADAEPGLGDDVPTLVVDSSSSRHFVQFDGNDCMRIPTFAGLTGQNVYDVFIVAYGSNAAQTVFSGYAPAGHGIRIETTATSYRFLHRMPFGTAGGDNLVSTQAFSRTSLDVLTAWRDASVHALRRPGSAEQTVPVSAPAFDTDLTVAIGCLDVDSPSRHLVGGIGEILVYEGLGDADRTAVEDYLSRKWLGQAL